MNDMKSNSELATWRDCRRKWWLNYFRRLSLLREEVQRPRQVGTLIHQSTEAYYANGFSQEAAFEVLNGFVMAEQDKQEWSEAEVKELKWIADTSRIMLEGYFEWLAETGVNQGLTVIAPEKEIIVPLPGTDVRLGGKLDVVMHNDVLGVNQTIERKTVDKFADLEPTASINTQFRMYTLLHYLDNPDNEIAGMILEMMRRTKQSRQAKPPFYKRVELWHSRKMLRVFWNHVIATLNDIDEATRRLAAGEDHNLVAYPSPDKSCTWKCDYFRICGSLDDPDTDVDELVGRRYEVKDQYERYTGIAEASAEPVVS
jgi:hypothetical protein